MSSSGSLAGTVRKHSVMAVVVLSRPAQARPITHTHGCAHVSETQGGSFIQQHILSRLRQAIWGGGGGSRLSECVHKKCHEAWRYAALISQVSSETCGCDVI